MDRVRFLDTVLMIYTDDDINDDNAIYKLTEKGKEVLVDWCIALIENNYEIVDGDSGSFYQAAGFLIANGYSTNNVDATAVILAGWACPRWEEMKEVVYNYSD